MGEAWARRGTSHKRFLVVYYLYSPFLSSSSSFSVLFFYRAELTHLFYSSFFPFVPGDAIFPSERGSVDFLPQFIYTSVSRWPLLFRIVICSHLPSPNKATLTFPPNTIPVAGLRNGKIHLARTRSLRLHHGYCLHCLGSLLWVGLS